MRRPLKKKKKKKFRGTSLLSVVGKVYGRVLINRIRDKNSIFVVKYIFPKYVPEFINNRLSSRCSECTAARFKYPASRPGGGGRYTLPLRAVSSTRHSPLHTAHRLRGGR